LHCSTTYVDAAYCYRPSSMVCLSVGWSICHSSEPCKDGSTDRDAVCIEDSSGSKEADPACKGVTFKWKNMFGHAQQYSAVSCATMAEPIEMPFGLCTRVGPRKHVLDGVKIPCVKGHFLGEGHAQWHSALAIGCAKMAEAIEMPFGLWTRVGRWKHVLHEVGCTLATTGEYDWAVYVLRWCGLMSSYFDHWLYMLLVKYSVYDIILDLKPRRFKNK